MTTPRKGLGRIFRETVWITAISGLIGVLANWLNPEGIPFVADREYEVLVPCPEPGGEVSVIESTDPNLVSEKTMVIDARTPEAFAAWQIPNAVNVPYDYLDPTSKETIQDLAKKIAQRRVQRVIVVGDGDQPDSGEQLGKEISGQGIRNVFFVKGGAPALEAQWAKGSR